MNGRTPAPEGGIGLQNVERRLQCYYGDAARFTLTAADNGETVAEITLPAGEVGDDDAAALIQHTRG
jgi:sensor histidine kinase YesM